MSRRRHHYPNNQNHQSHHPHPRQHQHQHPQNYHHPYPSFSPSSSSYYHSDFSHTQQSYDYQTHPSPSYQTYPIRGNGPPSFYPPPPPSFSYSQWNQPFTSSSSSYAPQQYPPTSSYVSSSSYATMNDEVWTPSAQSAYEQCQRKLVNRSMKKYQKARSQYEEHIFSTHSSPLYSSSSTNYQDSYHYSNAPPSSLNDRMGIPTSHQPRYDQETQRGFHASTQESNQSWTPIGSKLKSFISNPSSSSMSHLSSRGRRSHKGLGFLGSMDPSLEWTPLPHRPNWFTVVPKFEQEWVWPVPSIISEQFYIRFVFGGVLSEALLPSTLASSSSSSSLPINSNDPSVVNQSDTSMTDKEKEKEKEKDPSSFKEKLGLSSNEETFTQAHSTSVAVVTVAELDAMMESSCILEEESPSSFENNEMDPTNHPILDTSDTKMKVIEDTATTIVQSNQNLTIEKDPTQDKDPDTHAIPLEMQETFDQEDMDPSKDVDFNIDVDEAMEAHETRLMSVYDAKDGTPFFLEDDDEVEEPYDMDPHFSTEGVSDNEELDDPLGEENEEEYTDDEEEGVEIIVNNRYNDAYLTPHDLAYFNLSPNELEQAMLDDTNLTSYPSFTSSKKGKKKKEIEIYSDEVSVSDSEFIKAFSGSTKELDMCMPMSRKAQKQLAKLQRQKFEDVPPVSIETLNKNPKKSDFQTGGLDLARFDEIIQNFVNDYEKKEMLLDIFPKPLRVQLHALARSYRLKTVSHGKGHFKSIALVKTKQTCIPDPTSKFYANRAKLLNLSWDSSEVVKAPKVNKNQTKTFGLNVPPISSDNIGHQILQGLGWQPGTTIGLRSSGIKDPLFATMRKKRLGLGN